MATMFEFIDLGMAILSAIVGATVGFMGFMLFGDLT
jgi:hypothetical protein